MHAVVILATNQAGALVPKRWAVRPGRPLLPVELTSGWLTEYVSLGLKRRVLELPRSELWPATASCHEGWW